jgi:hypothetical protein
MDLIEHIISLTLDNQLNSAMRANKAIGVPNSVGIKANDSAPPSTALGRDLQLFVVIRGSVFSYASVCMVGQAALAISAAGDSSFDGLCCVEDTSALEVQVFGGLDA